MFRLPKPLSLEGGHAWRLVQFPSSLGGVIGAKVEGKGLKVHVAGENVRGAEVNSWRMASPLLGSVFLTSRRKAQLRALTLWLYRPKVGEDLDRHAIHLELWPGEELRLPLPTFRCRRRIEQVAIHWGSVEYRRPERRLPLGAWGYPYYLDGVLGDVFADSSRRRHVLARGKFVEFDEVENIRGFKPRRAKSLVIRLRSRDGFPVSHPCRIAAVEVRYAPLRPSFHRVSLGARVTPQRPVTFRLGGPKTSAPRRIDVVWRDEGPAMGSLTLGCASSGWKNVCSGERRTFSYFFGAKSVEFTLRAKDFPFEVEALYVNRGRT